MEGDNLRKGRGTLVMSKEKFQKGHFQGNGGNFFVCALYLLCPLLLQYFEVIKSLFLLECYVLM